MLLSAESRSTFEGMAFTNFVPTQLNNVRLAVLTGKILLKTGDCEQAVGEGQVRKVRLEKSIHLSMGSQ